MGNQPPQYNPDNYIDDTELELDPSSYANNGMYINAPISCADLAEKSIEDQAEYSDAICRRYAKNPIFCNLQKAMPMDWSQKTLYINNTSIGNAAFMCLANPDDVHWATTYDRIVNRASQQ